MPAYTSFPRVSFPRVSFPRGSFQRIPLMEPLLVARSEIRLALGGAAQCGSHADHRPKSSNRFTIANHLSTIVLRSEWTPGLVGCATGSMYRPHITMASISRALG